ncbi:SDR family NAD(P)-dependent oxidoreductase [Leucobacter sp. USHLN154]|uniref:SDR family NAD(P)-dependent oxidoreductase n=1 Tax=Leucobacter sp. USHLN154 TaxID=3081269 RepID=UPI00301AA0C0
MTHAAPSVLITGATGGIGRETARRFAQEGHRIVVADLAQAGVDAFAEELRGEFSGIDVLPLVVDQSDEDSLRSAAETVRTWSGGELNALALVAGTVQAEGVPVEELSVEEWDRVHSVNLRGVFLASKHFIPIIATGGSGSIIAIASYWGREAHPFFASYCTSKAGVISFVQGLAGELADRGIRVNAVAPGNIDTNMHRKALTEEAETRGISFEEMRDIEWAKIPLKAAGPPRSIADAVYFLSTEHASYITGATLDVNGGVVMT